jgi:hypothetical protein
MCVFSFLLLSGAENRVTRKEKRRGFEKYTKKKLKEQNPLLTQVLRLKSVEQRAQGLIVVIKLNGNCGTSWMIVLQLLINC